MTTIAVIHTVDEASPRVVAFVEVNKDMSLHEKLEAGFMLTNSINHGWWDNKEVTPMFDGKTCRSTTIGDHVLVDHLKYEVKPEGWFPVPRQLKK